MTDASREHRGIANVFPMNAYEADEAKADADWFEKHATKEG